MNKDTVSDDEDWWGSDDETWATPTSRPSSTTPSSQSGPTSYYQPRPIPGAGRQGEASRWNRGDMGKRPEKKGEGSRWRREDEYAEDEYATETRDGCAKEGGKGGEKKGGEKGGEKGGGIRPDCGGGHNGEENISDTGARGRGEGNTSEDEDWWDSDDDFLKARTPGTLQLDLSLPLYSADIYLFTYSYPDSVRF